MGGGDDFFGFGRLRSDIVGEEAFFGDISRFVKSDVLMRLRVSSGSPDGVMCFGSRNPEAFGPEQATEMGMGMFMAVGRGSDNPPRLIVMRSGGEGEKDALGRHLAIVGKGVCFDSGGISIKPADRMEEMKMDKSGAATVIAAIATVARLAPGTPLLALAPAVENMPGPHSTRPGDVVTALNGKKVDIPSYSLKAGDVITVLGRSQKNTTIEHAMQEVKGRGIPEWLTFDGTSVTGRVLSLPTREQINLPVQEQLIVELYSK